MRRFVTIASSVLAVALALSIYPIENQVRQLERRLADLDGDLLANRQAIQVLKAEWSYLNRPERLQALAARHVEAIALAPVSPDQIVTFAELPDRPEPDGEPETRQTARMAQ